jgi:hypothetical protein
VHQIPNIQNNFEEKQLVSQSKFSFIKPKSEKKSEIQPEIATIEAGKPQEKSKI